MRNTGLVSVGHLLVDKKCEDYKGTFKNFCTLLYCNLDDNILHRMSGNWRFDQFFKNINPCVESFSKFLNGLLRCQDADPIQFQMEIEKIVWDAVKFTFVNQLDALLESGNLRGQPKDKVTERQIKPVCRIRGGRHWIRQNSISPLQDCCNERSIAKITLYQLFSIFNRFCKFDSVPMKIEGKTVPFVFHKLGIVAPMDYSLTLGQFLVNVTKRRDNFVLASIQNVYDEYVRDVIIEGKVLTRVGPSRNSLPGSPSCVRKVIVTSRHLTIHEAPPDSLKPPEFEPDPIYKFSLEDSEFQVGRQYGTFIFGPRPNNCVTVVTANNNYVQLILDTKKDAQIVFKWTSALSEAQESIKMNVDRLTRGKLIHGLKVGDWLVDEKESSTVRQKTVEEKSGHHHSKDLRTSLTQSAPDLSKSQTKDTPNSDKQRTLQRERQDRQNVNCRK